MLVLSRRIGEKLMIGDDVVLTVLEVRQDGSVRLGIEAPRSVKVNRAEVVDLIRRENQLAAQVTDDAAAASLRELTVRPPAG